MRDIKQLVDDDDDAPGSPSKDMINRCLAGTELPQQADVVAIARVLARDARWDVAHTTDKTIGLWLGARSVEYAGEPVRNFDDPFALRVHELIESADGDLAGELPVYVKREHDEVLRLKVELALGGDSAHAMLSGESSTGKTRACWEAAQSLPDHWRLWAPLSTDQALEELSLVAPHTVIWLDEAHTFFLTPGSPSGPRLAAELTELLRLRRRAPVLLLGTIWPRFLSTLRTIPSGGSQHDEHASARRLLDPMRYKRNDRIGPGLDVLDLRLREAVIPVPDDFAGPAIRRKVEEAALTDTRWAEALANAEDGRLTQYMAGGPEIKRRYQLAPPAARALIEAAMDLRRLGHGPELPAALLASALPGYIGRAAYDLLDDTELQRVWAYVSDPAQCRGARPPLGEIAPAGRGTPGGAARPTATHYRLSDSLDHEGRIVRLDHRVPAELWRAAAEYADPSALLPLADAARTAGAYPDACRLYTRAVEHGEQSALLKIRDLPGREAWVEEALPWLQARAEAGDLNAQHVAVHVMRSVGRFGEAEDWLWSRAETGAIDALREGVRLLGTLKTGEGARRRLESMVERGDRDALTEAADQLRAKGKAAEAIVLYGRAADLGDPIALRLFAVGLLDSGRSDEALTWLRSRSDSGDVDALGVRVEVMRSLGLYGEMLDWLRGRISAGDFAALAEALAYFDDAGLEDAKLEWYQQAALAGHTAALMPVADGLAARGRTSEALDWYRHTAIITHNRIAMHRAGRILLERGEMEEARSWLDRPAGLDQGAPQTTP
ncbi:tetratricopeptide repeat protein [Streptomyces sp. NPDC056512]|uniref:tetratricopeptide repeat protein n=1 Tax=Streptomyces sp. NPDC056512 TaxID=3345846 RepID=UPI0036C441D8